LLRATVTILFSNNLVIKGEQELEKRDMVLRGKDLMAEKIIFADEEDGVTEAAKLALAWQTVIDQKTIHHLKTFMLLGLL
jgi:hypothetical protein